MKKVLLIVAIIVLYNNLLSQILSGNCTGNVTGTIFYDPVSDGYLNNAGFNQFLGSNVATLDYKIHPAFNNTCGTIKKPIIVVEGFDVEEVFDNNNNAIYDFFEDAADDLRSSQYGYHDIITVNFSNSKDYIERNAFALIELIKQINNSKVSEDEIIIIGASMGGLVTRYALSYMEANNIKHRCKLFIAFDTPNKGANIPLGVQFMLNAYHNNPITTGFVLTEWFALNCPSASQMLRHHILSGATPPTLNVNMTKFFNKLRGLNGCFGYPKDCKSYAVTLGALNSTAQLANNGSPMVSGQIAFDYVAPFIQAGEVRTYPAPPVPSGGLVNISQNVGLFINTDSNKPSSIPVDAAPGGFSTIFEQVADGIAALSIAPSVNKVCNKSCFIPTISSIDYNTTDLFYNVASDISANTYLANTPFENFISSNNNTNKEHIAFPVGISEQISVRNLIVNSINNNVCGQANLQINGGSYTQNYYDKAQNKIEIENLTVNNNKIFDVFAGNEIEIKNEVEITAGTEFRAYIKSCTAAKSCAYAGNALRVLNNANDNFEFTCESYTAKLDSLANNKISKLSNNSAIGVYPNPTTGNLNVNFFVTNAKSVSICIEDITGKQLMQQTINVEAGYSTNQLNLQEYVNGIYILKIADGNGNIIKVEKVVVNR